MTRPEALEAAARKAEALLSPLETAVDPQSAVADLLRDLRAALQPAGEVGV